MGDLGYDLSSSPNLPQAHPIVPSVSASDKPLHHVGAEFNLFLSGINEYPELDTFTNGRFVVTWEHTTDGFKEVYAQVFRRNGTPLTPTPIVVNSTDITGIAARPEVAAFDESNHFIVAWEGNDSSGRGIYARIFDGSGNPITEEFLVNVNSAGNQVKVKAQMLSTQEVVLAWVDESDNHVYARKFNNLGETLVGAVEMIHNATTEGRQANPKGSSLGDLGYVLTWEHTRADQDIDIRMRRFDNTGLPLGGDITVNTTIEQVQRNPVIGSAASGDYVIAWESFGQDGDLEGIYFQKFDADGDLIGQETQVNQKTIYEQFSPSIAVDQTPTSDGAFVVAWTSFEHEQGNAYDVMVRCYSSAGLPLGNERIVNTTTDLDQQHPTLAYLPAGVARYVVIWESRNPSNNFLEIHGQRLSANCSLNSTVI